MGRLQPEDRRPISIHALREEGDRRPNRLHSLRTISIHALREEGDPSTSATSASSRNFYPRPPRGGRRTSSSPTAPPRPFLSTPSARRATRQSSIIWSERLNFYPRPPRGGRHSFAICLSSFAYFYPRPPRGGRRTSSSLTSRQSNFYPRPPRGGRPRKAAGLPPRPIFLSTPSARRATTIVPSTFAMGSNFYPRPPRGGRHRHRRGGHLRLRFLSTPSARRATAKTETKSLFSYKLYNILHEFRRALIYNGSKNYPNHAK